MAPKRPQPTDVPSLLSRGASIEEDPGKKNRLSTKAERQEFFLPVTGFAWFYPEEMAVINHPAFQRLSRINQLGQAYFVFRGATHKRIEHVLGAVGIAQSMIAAVQFNSEKAKARGREGYSTPLSEHEQRFVRLGALLHDIGHLAAGHTLEDELELIGKHDDDKRLDTIFERTNWEGSAARGVPCLRDLVNSVYDKCVPPGLASKGVSATDVVRLLIRKPPEKDVDRFLEAQQALDESSEIRWHVCVNMIGNTICADLLDYLYRDWYHVGRPRPMEDRIFQYMEIRCSAKPRLIPVAPSSHPDDRFVIALGEKTKIRTDGVSAILGLLEWRYELAETVLFHRTKVAAGAMLDRALFELWETRDADWLVEKLLLLSDDQLLDEAVKEAETQKKSSTEERHEKLNAIISLLQKLRDRALFKELGTFDATNLPDPHIARIKKDYSGQKDSPGSGAIGRSAAKRRAQTARDIERDFDLPIGSIAIYCSQVQPKIAQVSIAVDDEISPFSEYEKAHKDRLSGGHLAAQIERFGRLWRIYFFIDAQVKEGLSKDRLLLIQQSIEQVLLAVDEPGRLAQRAKEKAMAYVYQEKKAGKNAIEFVDEPVVAAKGDATTVGPGTYPNGAPYIRSFVRRH